MRFFRRLFQRRNDPMANVRPILDRMALRMEGRRLADKALSHRALGQHDEALRLLHRVLAEYDYKPAITLIGTTMVQKGDLDGAIQWFTSQINKYESGCDYPLMELYSNLGAVLGFLIKDVERGIEYYEQALAAPRGPCLGESGYRAMASNIHHKLALLYLKAGDLRKASGYAALRLEVAPDCKECQGIELAGRHFTVRKNAPPASDDS